MLSKMKKSVVICMNSLISVIIFCMIIMLLCSCVSAARTTWKQAKKTYHSMVEYYTRDVENNLRNISDYLLRISETADYYGMTNCEEDKESMNNLSRQRLYNQLNEDILIYSSADYFFIFQDKYADIMMVESAKKKAKIQSQNIREQLKRLLESREPTEKWELFDAEGYQYLIRVVSKDGVGIGCAVSLNRLIETMQAVQLSDYYVSYYKIGTMILDNESGKDLKIELPIQETDVGVRIVIPSEKLFEEIRTLLNFSMVFAVILIILLFALYISMYHWFTNPVKRIVSVMQKVDEEGIDLKMPELRYGCYDYLLKPVMEDDIIKVMKNLVTKIERERHQAQLQEEGIVWNQLKPVWKEKYWEEMLRGLRDDPNRECEEYEEKQWKEEQDRRLIPILFYQYANDKTEEDIKQTRKKVKEDLGTVAGDFLLPVLSQKEFAGLVFISDEWLSSGTERNGIILKDAILQQFKTERLYEKIGICIGEVCTGREVQSMVDKLRQFAWNNVCSRRQILDIINMPKNSEAIGMPDMTLWKAYLDNGKTVELQDKIRKWLWGKDNEAKLNRRALQMLQYDLEQLFYSTLQENGIQAHQFLYDRENGCNRVTAIGSLEEMDAWIEETMGAVSRIMQDVSNLSGIREQTIYYIQTHLDEELNRIKVASALYLNPDYLDRRFKKEMGCSVNRYILREQVNMAKGLLLNPKISICEIASRCGYENMSNFSAMFKREVGISPNEYRKNGGMESPDL